MKDFQGFRFGQIHTKDLHLIVVSTSSRFIKNLLPSNTDYSVDVPGGNGKYYFGLTYGVREFISNVTFEDMDEVTWRRLSQILSNDKPQDLVFDENPYKTYRAKVSSKPDFKYICFRDENTGERVYKGEGTISFICYHPFAFCFNRYIVRAADYYRCTCPKEIIEKSFSRDFDKTVERSKDIVKPYQKTLYGDIKAHFNVDKNMNTPWKGGYPTIELVLRGELYFGEPDENKMIINVRGYWDNVPLWAKASKILTTPTLDYDLELIYCPQYSRTNYYNMDTGLNKQNFALGSRLLVYNPGDIPIDFELKLGNLTSDFRSNNTENIFRISRYNVLRLSIEQAVDWLGLKVREDFNEDEWKYGSKYFTIAEKNSEENTKLPKYKELNINHPNHCYIVEPIPQEKLSHFIRLFYWQSNLLFNKNAKSGEVDSDKEFYSDGIELLINRHIIDCKMGDMYADRYEELRSQCITDDEKNELYWITLKEAILDRYRDINEVLELGWFTEEEEEEKDKYTYDDFVYDFIFNPLEYIRYDNNLDYGEFNFNITRYPQFMTFDYFDISNKNFSKIPYSACGCDNPDSELEHHREQILPLILDSERRMLYNNNEPEWINTEEFLNTHSEKADNFYNYKGTKTIWNDNIVRGHWFQLPPGWSMIDISPLVDEDNWGGKRWLDARPFDWGDTNETESEKDCYRELRELYELIYKGVAIKFITSDIYGGPEPIIPINDSTAVEDLEEYILFRRWYSGTEVDDSKDLYNLRYSDYVKSEEELKKLLSLFPTELLLYRRNKAELSFLKEIAEWWRINKPDGNDIDDWWWWANHYIWANFPPVYWSYADLLNKAEIKYIPLYY